MVHQGNSAIAFSSTSGQRPATPGVVSLNEFYGYPVAFDRRLRTFGPSIFEPQCYRDPASGRWYLAAGFLGVEPRGGSFTGQSGLLIAVSRSASPLLGWNRFFLDTSNTDEMGCERGCFANGPRVGADRYGFYVSGDDFGVFSNAFHGSEIYAFSKRLLEDGSAASAIRLRPNQADGHEAYAVAPAQSPSAAEWDTSNNGTEYLMASYDDPNPVAQIGLFAVTNTRSRAGGTPEVRATLVGTEPYANGPNSALPTAVQRQGPTPLGTSVGEAENALDAGDTQMQQVFLQEHLLWASLGTAVSGEARLRDGIAWFAVSPSITGGELSGSETKQGYLAARGANLLDPAIAMNAEGRGGLSMSLAGPAYFPSAAQVLFLRDGPTSGVTIDALGVRPEDGFSCYAAYDPNGDRSRGCRWGDRSSAQMAPGGDAVTEASWVSGDGRGFLVNAGTFLDRITPSAPGAG